MPSYSPVYSAAFIQYTSETPNLTFEVPAGFTAVARYGTVLQDIGTYGSAFYLKDSEAAPALFFDYASDLGVLEIHDWSGRIVVPEGGILGALLTELGAAPNVYLGGYLLRNTLT